MPGEPRDEIDQGRFRIEPRLPAILDERKQVGEPRPASGWPTNNQFLALWEAYHSKRNWLLIGHPDAGPRLANLFTVLENCRQAGVEPTAYLIDLIASRTSCAIADWLPRLWQRRRADGIATS